MVRFVKVLGSIERSLVFAVRNQLADARFGRTNRISIGVIAWGQALVLCGNNRKPILALGGLMVSPTVVAARDGDECGVGWEPTNAG